MMSLNIDGIKHLRIEHVNKETESLITLTIFKRIAKRRTYQFFFVDKKA
jgi:hypothetical protein